MKPAVIAFLNYASDVGLPKRDKAALLVFSRLIAYQLPLPSSPVDSPVAYYTNILTNQVDGFVSELNESIVIDVPFLREMIRKVWQVRYELVYSPTSQNVNVLVSAILTQDNDAFSLEILEASAELSVDNRLNNLVNLCLVAEKQAVSATQGS